MACLQSSIRSKELVLVADGPLKENGGGNRVRIVLQALFCDHTSIVISVRLN